MYRKFILIFISVVYCTLVYANKPTVQQAIINHIREYVENTTFEQAVIYKEEGKSQEAIETMYKAYLEGKEQKNLVLETGALQLYATWLIYQGRSKESVQHYFEVIDRSGNGNHYLKAIAHSAIGQIYNMRGDHAGSLHHQKAFHYYAEHHQDDPFVLGSALRTLGQQYLRLNQLDSAYLCLSKAYSIDVAINDEEGLIRDHNALGKYHEKIGNHEEAITYYLKWQELTRKLNNKVTKSIPIYVSLSLNFQKLNNLERAEFYAQEALKIARENNSRFYIINVLKRCAEVAESQFNYTKAQSYYQEALEKSTQYEKRRERFGSLMGLARIESEIGKEKDYFQYLKQAVALADSMDIADLKASSLTELGQYFFQKGVSDQALIHLDKAFDQAVISRDLSLQQRILKTQSDIYSAQNKHTAAYKKLHLSNLFKDSLEIRNSAEAAFLAEARFRFREKEYEIERLDLDNQILEQKNKSGARWRIFLSTAIALLGLLLFGLFRLYRKGKKQKQIIENALKEREVLLKEIHHRVKNNLQVISSLLNMHSRQIDNPDAQQAMLEGRNRVKSMALIHQNLYSEDDLVNVDTQEYIDKLIHSIIYSYKLDSEDIDISIEVDPIKMDVDTVIPLGLVINELVSNAMKYAFVSGKGKLDVSLKNSEYSYKLVVQDDGPGFEEGTLQSSKSLGYKIINAFVKKMKADLNISGSQGTRVELDIPR